MNDEQTRYLRGIHHALGVIVLQLVVITFLLGTYVLGHAQ